MCISCKSSNCGFINKVNGSSNINQKYDSKNNCTNTATMITTSSKKCVRQVATKGLMVVRIIVIRVTAEVLTHKNNT